MWRNPHQDIGKTAERWRDLKAAICDRVTAFDAREAWFLILEGGIGDCMHVLTYLRAFRETHGGPIIAILSSGLSELAALFSDEIDTAIFLERSDIRALRATTAFARFERGEPIVTWWPAHGDGRISSFHDWPGGLTIRDVARVMLRLPPSAAVNRPAIPESAEADAQRILADHGLRPGQTVVLFPLANTAPRHPVAWWIAMASHLKGRGYDVAVNTGTTHAKVKHGDGANPTATEAFEPLLAAGTPVDLSLAQVIPFVEACGAFVLTASGMGDLLAFADAKKLVIFPCRREEGAPERLDLSVCHGGKDGGGSLIRCHEAADCTEVDLPLEHAFDPDWADRWLDTAPGAGTASGAASPALDLAKMNTRILQSVVSSFQQSMHALNRPVIAGGMAKIVRRETDSFALPWTEDDREAAFEKLAEDGISKPFTVLSTEARAEVLAALKDEPVYNAHTITRSDGVARHIGAGAEDYQYGAFKRSALLDAPHLLEAVTAPAVMKAAYDYLGCLPKLYSFNAFWNFPSPKVFKRNEPLYSGVQTFHRDSDDFRFLSLFIFLDGSDGDHVYYPGSHTTEGTKDLFGCIKAAAGETGKSEDLAGLKPEDLFRGAGLNTAFGAVTPEGFVRVKPSPGLGFLSDPFGVHRGEVPSTSRLLLTARYGLYSNTSPTYEEPHGRKPWSRIKDRVPPGKAMRYVMDLMVDFD